MGAPAVTLGSEDPSDCELARRAITDAESFGALYDRHYGAVVRHVRRRLGDFHWVEDVVAETFLEALRCLPRFLHSQAPFARWLLRIASHRASHHARRMRYRQTAQLPRDVTHAPDTRDWARVDRVRLALARVPSRFQSILALYYLEGMSVAEIAEAAEMRPGTVKSRLSRGRAALKRILDGEAP